MARCEDFPCCGHEAGLCPDFDSETGKQLNMRCVCGAAVPLSSRVSICEGCLRRDAYDEDRGYDGYDVFDEYDEG